jgi:hypothetical protein
MQITPAPPVTVDHLAQRVGYLTVQLEAANTEIQRLYGLLQQYTNDLKAEVTKIETEAEVEEKAVADKIKAVVARVKAKL